MWSSGRRFVLTPLATWVRVCPDYVVLLDTKGSPLVHRTSVEDGLPSLNVWCAGRRKHETKVSTTWPVLRHTNIARFYDTKFTLSQKPSGYGSSSTWLRLCVSKSRRWGSCAAVGVSISLYVSMVTVSPGCIRLDYVVVTCQ